MLFTIAFKELYALSGKMLISIIPLNMLAAEEFIVGENLF